MATTGMITSYSDTGAHKRVVTDYIEIGDPRDTPLLRYLGLNNQKKFRFVNWPGGIGKIEWLEDSMPPTSDQLAEALDSSETGVDVDNAGRFHVGDVIQVAGSDEQMWVSAITAPTLTVTRGYGGTTATTHADNAIVHIRSNARLEGAVSTDGYRTDISAPFNYFQIMHEEIKVSGSAEKMNQYGISSEYEYQLMKIMGGEGGGDGKMGNAGKLTIQLEKTAFYGKRLPGSATTPRAMGGLDHYITSNVTAMASAELTQRKFENSMQAAWEFGGKPGLAVVNAYAKRKIDSWYTGQIRTERRENVGGMTIDTIHTNFGDVDMLMDRWCPVDKMYILDTGKVGWCTLRPFTEEKLAKDGDYTRGQVIGEYTFVVCEESHHAIISGFSTTL